MKIKAFAVIVVAFLVGCKELSPKYDAKVIATDSLVLRSTTLCDSLFLMYPTQIEVCDSLLVIADYSGSDCFYLYSKHGMPLATFGKKGHGPGELVSPAYFSVTPSQSVIVFDYGQSKIVVYDVHSMLEGNKLTFEEIPIDLTSFYSALGETSPKGFRIADVLFFEPDKYLLIGNGSPMRYGWLTKEEIIPVYGEYPQCIESQNIEEVWSIFGSMPRIKLSDDRTKMVHATFIGAIMQFFAILPAGEIHNYQNRFIYRPEYGIAQGAVPTWVSSNENTKFGFHDLCVTNTSVYGLINSPNDKSYPKYITEFDWDGIPTVKLLSPEERLMLLCEDEGLFFAITFDDQNHTYSLVRLEK